MENLFQFVEEVFEDGQEMLILVTELTVRYYCAKFISKLLPELRHIVVSTAAPEVCPVCAHSQAYLRSTDGADCALLLCEVYLEVWL